MRQAVRAITALAALLFIVFGLWALIDPVSFYERLATFPPYNQHFLHDVGAFQAGIGASLAIALFRNDGLLVALGGGSVAAILHAISHFLDRDLGGRATDPYALTLLAALVVVAFVLHLSTAQRRRR